MEDVIFFDPQVSDLQAIIAETAKITATDLSDAKQLELVKATRIKLKKARVVIEKQGKTQRDRATDYSRRVMAREKELIGIIEPEEDRLQAIEAEAERIKVRAERMTSLPLRREQLAAIGDGIVTPDVILLDMDAEQFVAHMNGRKVAQFEKMEAARKAEETRVAREKEIEAAKARAVQDERDRAEKEDQRKRDEAAAAATKAVDDAKREAERIEREAREKVEREAKEKADAEAADAAEQAKLEKRKRYQNWLETIGYSEETKHLWKFEDAGDRVRAFSIKGEFIK